MPSSVFRRHQAHAERGSLSPVREVGDRIFQLDSTRGSVNIFFVQAGVPVLVDAGKPTHGDAVVEELRAAGVTPEIVLLTHSDFDHAGGAEHVRSALGSAIYAPAAERRLRGAALVHAADERPDEPAAALVSRQ